MDKDTHMTEIQNTTAVRLEQRPEGLTLTDGTIEIRADFGEVLPRLRTANLRQEMLVKAAKLKNPVHTPIRVLDATAGFGTDSLILAAAGFEVQLCEYNEIIASLLLDALKRAEGESALAEAVSRMRVTIGDSCRIMREMTEAPDVVLLDPMFPERTKSALVKKKFQLLHHLESPCSTEEELLEAAIALKPQKIVIKRPVKGALLAGRKPSYSLSGKAVRYDVVVL